MASTKRSEKGTPKLAMKTESDFESCAARLKALADPDRLQIVISLLQGDKSVTSLTDELGMPMDKVSHHLGVLRAANLVQTQKQGKFVIYSLAPEVAAAGASATGTKTIDLGCCQLDLVQLVAPPKKTRAPSRRAPS
ncbi:MAG TPA: metalloregulator ArsR/SmtB family transcription factor [Pirellulales bacterium]